MADASKLGFVRPRHQVVAAALSASDMATPARLLRLLADHSVEEAWERVVTGRLPVSIAPSDKRERWHRDAAMIDLSALDDSLVATNVVVSSIHSADHPDRLSVEPSPSAILFSVGNRRSVVGPRVAIVGTRRCTSTGREVASELGAGLAAAGVLVVSGLAAGIDAAAHRGALAAGGAPPVAVVGSGLDVPYPKSNAGLWAQVAAVGVIFSEAPIGAAPEAWRFPPRNRLIAGLADVVVVVESKHSGGSLHTVDAAERRGLTVMAVPGSLRNPAAEGTNKLIADGCPPVCGLDDVLMALGLSTATSPLPFAARSTSALTPDGLALIEAIGDAPTGLDQLAVRLAWPAPRLLAVIDDLTASGQVSLDGLQVERRGPG